MFRSIFGGGDSKAAQEAEQAYNQYAQQALDEMRRAEAEGRGDISGYFERGLGYEQPYMQAGQQGLQAYLGTLGLGGDQQTAINRFRTSPGYQFALQQGQQALQRQAAARGMSGSGAASRELARYGQGMADQEYGNYQNRLQGLASMGAGMGQTAAQQSIGAGQNLANLGAGYAGQIGSIYQGMGQSAANARMAQAQINAQRNAGLWNMLGQLGGSALGAFGGFQGLGSLGGGGSQWMNPDTGSYYQPGGFAPQFGF